MDKYLSEIERLRKTYSEIDREMDDSSQQFQLIIDSIQKAEEDEEAIKCELDRLKTAKKYKGFSGVKTIFKAFLSPFKATAKETKELVKYLIKNIKRLDIIFVLLCIVLVSFCLGWTLPIIICLVFILLGVICSAKMTYLVLKEINPYKDTDIDYEIEECERRLSELFSQKQDSKLAFRELFSKGQTLSARIKETSSEIESLQQEREDVIHRIVPEEAINQEFDKARSRKRQSYEQ